MKKNILKLALFALLAVPALQSCELDQFPAGSIPNEESFQTLEDLAKFDRGTMADIRGISRVGWQVSDVQADYFQPNLSYGNRLGMVYRWEFTDNEDDIVSAYTGPYGALVDFNNFLNNYQKALPEEGTAEYDAALEEVSQYVANAYFGRALAYYSLVTRFAKDFEPATAAEDLGVVITTEVDLNYRAPRASVERTYEFISEQLELALQFCRETEPSVDYIAEPVIKFLQARVALDTHNYGDAVTIAKDVIENYGFELAQSQDDFANVWLLDEGNEIVFEPAATQDEPMSWGLWLTFSNNKYQPDWIPSQATLDLYDFATDYRAWYWFRDTGFSGPGNNSEVTTNGSEDFDSILLFGKYQGNTNIMLNSDDVLHTYKNVPKTFRLAELYLIAAEAAYQNGDETTAQQYIADLQTSRGLTPVFGGSGSLFNVIKLEWKKEFIGEGQRLICLKRWHEGFTRDARAQVDNLIETANSSRGIGATINANDQRFVWDIPLNDKTHGGIPGNWSL